MTSSRSRSLRILLAFIGTLATLCSPLMAQRPKPFDDPAEEQMVRQRLQSFLDLAATDTVFTTSMIAAQAVDEVAATIVDSNGHASVFARNHPRIDSIRSLGFGDSLAMANVVTRVDSVRWFGPVDVDWVYYLRRGDFPGWRISEVRRMMTVEKGLRTLHVLDTSRMYPEALKPTIAAETSRLLLSNRQMRALFARDREHYQWIADQFIANDSLRQLQRTSDRVVQLNNTMIDWGIASVDIPDSIMNDWMATLTPKQQSAMQQRLRVAERMKKTGVDSLAAIVRRFRLGSDYVQTVVDRMQRAEVIFVNAALPWKDDVQLTVAGEMENAVGFIYAPHDELPEISPMEYYYLENLGGGWWLFRST